jgi:hypothetical protein
MCALSGLSTECNTIRVVYRHLGTKYETVESNSKGIQQPDRIGGHNILRKDRDEKDSLL